MPRARERKDSSAPDLNFPQRKSEYLYEMNSDTDLLYSIFEHYLFNALVENETTDEFLSVVVRDYLQRLSLRGAIPFEHVAGIELDVRDEVLDMLRKKTYGHYSLTAFRKAHLGNSEKKAKASPAQTDPAARRSRRAS